MGHTDQIGCSLLVFLVQSCGLLFVLKPVWAGHKRNLWTRLLDATWPFDRGNSTLFCTMIWVLSMKEHKNFKICYCNTSILESLKKMTHLAKNMSFELIVAEVCSTPHLKWQGLQWWWTTNSDFWLKTSWLNMVRHGDPGRGYLGPRAVQVLHSTQSPCHLFTLSSAGHLSWSSRSRLTQVLSGAVS